MSINFTCHFCWFFHILLMFSLSFLCYLVNNTKTTKWYSLYIFQIKNLLFLTYFIKKVQKTFPHGKWNIIFYCVNGTQTISVLNLQLHVNLQLHICITRDWFLLFCLLVYHSVYAFLVLRLKRRHIWHFILLPNVCPKSTWRVSWNFRYLKITPFHNLWKEISLI